MLTFIVPVRHPENARDWTRVRQVLEQTAASIAGQESDEWSAVVVANSGSDLPPLPLRFRLGRPNILVRNSLRLRRLTTAQLREFGMARAVGEAH